MQTTTKANSFKAIMMALGLVFLGLSIPACGSDVDGEEGTFHLSLEEEGAEAVESAGYCDRAEKAKKLHPKKVAICHIPPGNPANAHTIVVSKKAMRAHLDHGDVLGPCGCDDGGEGGDTTPGGGDDGTPDGSGETTHGGHGDHDHDHGDDGNDPDGDDGDDSTDGGDGATSTGGEGEGTNGSGDTSTTGAGGEGEGTSGNGETSTTGSGGDGSTGAGYGDTSTTGSGGEGTSGAGEGSTSGGTTSSGGVSGPGSANVCDADQTTCSENHECPTNNVCDLGCCVYVIL